MCVFLQMRDPSDNWKKEEKKTTFVHFTSDCHGKITRVTDERYTACRRQL